MADECPIMTLQREVTCPICLDYLTDPYTVDCGHYFCRVCINRCVIESTAKATCPQCRAEIHPENFSPNKDIVRFVVISKRMSRYRDWGPDKRDTCEIHQEPLKIFCKNDQVRICSVCDRSEEHENHDTIPVDEAAHELKGLIFTCLHHVRQERDKVTHYRTSTEEEHHELRLKMTEGKEKITTAFRILREFLTDAELLVGNELSQLEKEIGRTMEENLNLACEKLASFELILENMADMCRLPEDELLQTAGKNLQRWAREKFDRPVEYAPALKWRIWELCDLHNFMEISVNHIQVLFDSGFRVHYNKVNVILDSATAHPRLAVSEDCKVVRWDHQDRGVFDNPRRFNLCPCVLGCEGFNSGKVYWEVDVGIEGDWAIGVAKESLKCKGKVVLNSEKGIYAIGKCGDQYFAFERMNFTFPWRVLKAMRIRVSLDYIGAGVVFSDADEAVQLFEFREESFHNEKLYPFFWLHRGGQLKIPS
ncbi:zinc finger protein RFP-like isoform X2 [Heteronotia binoei]|uniref:zinc finger protein RFP-like isoform X2 n=1 Tax=Heteronotia binoei TaxID=13085 RepID=UPI00292DA7CE|nr:zinc finger protein RFP-like isoform X2 [Heteronotia binoei]